MAYSKLRTGHLSKKRDDTIVTPDWAARDMIRYFRPRGRVLEPCRGGGAIYQYMPKGSFWCEIQEGRDFFDFNEPVDWTMTNPPYSNIRSFFQHAMEISANVVFLIPIWKAFLAEGFFRELDQWGGSIVHIRRYGTGSRLGFPMGNAIGAVHIAKRIADLSWSTYVEDELGLPV